MLQIEAEQDYKAAMERIDELLFITSDELPIDDPNIKELVLLSDLVEEYEKEHCPIEPPSLVNALRQKMFEEKAFSNCNG